jgi:hypothetical protein
MGRKPSGIEPQRQDWPVAAALRHEAPLAKSAAPVALQQSRILRMTLQDRQVEMNNQASPRVEPMKNDTGEGKSLRQHS